MKNYIEDRRKAQEILDKIHQIEDEIKERTGASLETLNEYFSTENLEWKWEGSNLNMWKALSIKPGKTIPYEVADEGKEGYWHGQFHYPYQNATLKEILSIENDVKELEAGVDILRKGEEAGAGILQIKED